MCKNFIVKACVGIRKRHSVNDKILITTAKFDLERVISSDREETLSSLFPILPRISPNFIQDQEELDLNQYLLTNFGTK
jgi:hypothetical protein